MQWLHMLGGTFTFWDANGGGGNEADVGQKGQLERRVEAGSALCRGSLQARDRSQ